MKTQEASANTLLDFENEKVQSITLEQLQRTHKENDVYGKPVKGVYHHDLIKQGLSIFEEEGYRCELFDLFAAQNRERSTPGVVLLPQVEEIYGKNAVEAHILRRVYANIRVYDFDTEECTTNLAIAFHQRGIQVGIGRNVIICHNQCMLGAKHYAATYTTKGDNQKYDVPEIIGIMSMWVKGLREIVEYDDAKIERMKNTDLSADKLLLLIGMLTAIRVKCDSTNKRLRENRVYPLNQSQICSLTERMLLKYQEQNYLSVWDLYNAGTDMYKAQSMDMPLILPQNKAFVEFLDEQFTLN